MKNILSNLGILIALLILAVSCGPTVAQKEEARVRRNKTPNTIVWDTINSKQTQPLDTKTVSASSSLSIDYIAPQGYENKEVLKLIQGEINYTVMGDDDSYRSLSANDAVKKYTNDYAANYKKEAKSQLPILNKTNGGGKFFSYNKDIKTAVKYNEANLISYQVQTIESRADSTSTTTVKNIVLDLTNGGRLTEKDIFREGYRETLNKIIIEQILRDNSLSNIEELQERGYWGVSDLAVNDNFYVDKDGVTYTFNPNEYSDAELGVLKVFVNYDDLMDVLKEESPISILVDDLD